MSSQPVEDNRTEQSFFQQEYDTVKCMIAIYCHDHHGTSDALCSECTALLTYAEQRLQRCPLQPDKPVCAECRVHCYKPEKREQVRKIMRYAGPRMIYKHPILALLHLIHKRKSHPQER